MKTDNDDPLAAILACAATIRPEDVEAELEAAMDDPLLQLIVDRAVAAHEGDLTAEQLAESKQALLVYFVTDPRAERLLDQLRTSGGTSHVVETKGAAGTPPAAIAAVSSRRRRGPR